MKTILPLYLLLIVFFSCSRENEPDPQVPLDVDAQLNHYWNLYEAHLSTNPDSALYFMEELKKIAKANQEMEWLAAAYGAKADIRYHQGYLGEAVFLYVEAAEFFEKEGMLSQLANAFNSIGDIYVITKDYSSALSYLTKAKDIFIYKGTSYEKAMIFRNIAVCFQNLDRYDEAKEALALAMEEALSEGDFEMISRTYNLFGAVEYEQEEYEKAREFYLLAIENAKNLKNGKKLQAGAFNNIGETYLKEGDFSEAEEWLNKALAIKKELNDHTFIQSTLNTLGELYIEQEKYDVAVEILDKGLKKTDLNAVEESTEQGLALMIEALVKASAKSSTPAELASLNKRFSTYSSKLSVYNRKLSELQEKLETSSKQQAVQLATEKHTAATMLEASEERGQHIKLIAFILLLGAAYTIFWHSRQRKRTRKMIDAIDDVINRRPNPLVQKVQGRLPEL